MDIISKYFNDEEIKSPTEDFNISNLFSVVNDFSNNDSYGERGNSTKKVNDVFFSAFSNTNLSFPSDNGFSNPRSLNDQHFNPNLNKRSSRIVSTTYKEGNTYKSVFFPSYVPQHLIKVDSELIAKYLEKFKTKKNEISKAIYHCKSEFLSTPLNKSRCKSRCNSRYENIVNILFEKKFDFPYTILKNTIEGMECSFFQELERQLGFNGFNKNECDKIFNNCFNLITKKCFEFQNKFHLDRDEIVKHMLIALFPEK
jgi:hypothetical protein